MGIPPLSYRLSGNFDFEFRAVRQHTSDRFGTQCPARFSDCPAPIIALGDLIISHRIEILYDEDVCARRTSIARKKEFHENEFQGEICRRRAFPVNLCAS